MSSSIEIVDSYLEKWNEYVRGANAIVAVLNHGRPAFESALADLLAAGDRRAPARLVYSTVVRGFLPVDSKLGEAVALVIGPNFPVRNTPTGQRVYAARDLFLWWERNRDSHEAFPLFDEWAASDFAQQTIIPSYRKTATQANT